MTLITEKPQGIPTGNALDDIDTGIDVEGPTQIRMGGMILTTLDSYPGQKQRVRLMIEVETDELRLKPIKVGDDDAYELTQYLTAKLIDCWVPGKKKPKGDPNQGPLFEDPAVDDEPEVESEDGDA